MRRRIWFPPLLLVRDAAEHILVQHAGLGVEQAGGDRPVAKPTSPGGGDVVVDEVGDLGPERDLGDVGVDVDDEIVVGRAP